MQALVLEGGGMRAGWVTGALMALMDMGIRRFDAAAAVSASVPSLFCNADLGRKMSIFPGTRAEFAVRVQEFGVEPAKAVTPWEDRPRQGGPMR